jgi:CubicO group peptidase (beta-lactamase class C family)
MQGQRVKHVLVGVGTVLALACTQPPNTPDAGSNNGVDAGASTPDAGANTSDAGVDAGTNGQCLGATAMQSAVAGPGVGPARAAVEAVLADVPVAGAVVGLAVGSRVAWLEGFGLARPQDGTAATPDTPFAIASVTKTLVAVVIMQLVEEGRLQLDVGVGQQAPALAGVVNPAFPGVAITPRMLLTHTSSLFDEPFTFDETYSTSGDATLSMRDFVLGYFDPQSPYWGTADMWWPNTPGTFSCYSNMGVGVLGVLAQEISGQSLETLMQQRIFAPLGMTRTSFFIRSYCDPALLAQGVAWNGTSFVPDNLGQGPQPEGHPELASGMLRTTAHDLLRFAMAMGNGGVLDGARILSDATVAQLFMRQLSGMEATCGDGRADPAQQAVLWFHFPDPQGNDWVGHYGGMNGVAAAMWLLAGDNVRYVVIVNQADIGAVGRIEVAMLENLAGILQQ